jgi:DtxR family transcriptional regulator, Mn-dependent transcriptional regulator
VSCPGTTVPARLAQEIAARLEALPFEADGAEVIAVDGCADACATRALGARGVRATSVGLHELGTAAAGALGTSGREQLLAEVVERLRRAAERGPAARTPQRRPAAPDAAEAAEKRSHSADDYLYAIRSLTSPLVGCGTVVYDLPTLAAHVAHVLSVSRPTAGAMLDRLEAEGLVARGPAREILLTAAGHSGAGRLARRHRVVERMLTDVLGYAVAECHGLALQVRGDFDESMTERLAAQLAPPETCPHGWPLDPAREAALLADAVTLSAASPGPATVVALVEDDADMVGRLVAVGLLPGAAIELEGASAGGPAVVVAGARHRIDEAEAASVLVRARTGA